MRYAFRTLRHNPGFAAVAIVTLALGIGVNAAMFSAVNGVLLRPLPYAGVGQIVSVEINDDQSRTTSFSGADFRDLRDRAHGLRAVAGFREDLFAVSAPAGEPQQVGGAWVTRDFFEVLGAAPRLGRTFANATPGEKLAVISQATWHKTLADDPNAAGRSIRVNGQPYTIAGVMPQGIEWPGTPDLWVLSPTDVPPCPIEGGENDRRVRFFNVIGRLAPGTSLDQAQRDATALSLALANENPGSDKDHRLQLVPLREAIVGDVRLPLLVLQGAVALVLLIACANVSSLLIARATGRRRELAVRASLGARPGHLMRQLLTESLVLGAAGGALGLLIGAWLIRVLVKLIPPGLPRVEDIGLDWRVTVATVVVALFTGVLFGLLPAFQAGRTEAAAAMKDAGERESSGRSRGRSTLVVLEVAMTLVLLVGAGLLANSFLKLSRVDSGFKPEHVVVASLYIPQSRYPTAAAQIALENRILDRLSQQGAWQAYGIGFPAPLHGSNASGSLTIQDWPESKGTPFANLGTVSGGYFAAMGQTLLQGRTFTEQDRADGEGVAVVSDALAHRYWPGQSPIGKHVKFDDDPKTPWSTVVGLVSNARQLGLGEEAPPIAYLPYAQFPLPFTTVAVRSTMSIAAVSAALRSDMTAIDPDLPLSDMQALQTVLDSSVAEPRFRALMIGVFAALALLLAAVGLSGLVSYSVAQRTREFGIRVALGAQPRQVLLPLLREGTMLALAGIAIGVAGAFALTRALGGLLYGVTATDPVTFVAVSVLLLAVTILATYVPARRAMRVDPITALRQ